MPIVPPFVPDRFRSTVPFYAKYRLDYPSALLDEVVRRVGLRREDGILDLGCGPGTLSIALARAGFTNVTGMDPDPDMLAAAREEADKAQVPVRFIEGSSYDLNPASGPRRLVIRGRSFHWMDRVATLATLDVVVEPGGAVVTVAETPERAPENSWKQVLANVQQEFVGPLGDGGSKHHAAVFKDSAFCRVERYGVIERLSVTIDEIVGRAFSVLESSPEALGECMPAFETELRRRLRLLSPSGRFRELIEFSALIARRPTDRSAS